MRKKYLSALLFGALLFASAGTFTSCKDYDDDINNLLSQITANADAIKALQSKVDAGKWVTEVSAITNGFKVTFSDGQSFEVVNGADGAAGADGTQIAIGEDGYWYFDGEKSEYKAVSDEETGKTKAPYVNEEDGYWYFYNEDGTAQKSAYKALGAAYAVAYNGGFNIMIPDADGTMQTIFVPGAAASITSIDAVLDKGEAIEIDKYEFNPTSATKTTWKNLTGKTVTSSKYLLTSQTQINARINPVSVTASDVDFTLVNSKNEALPNVVFNANGYNEYVTDGNTFSRANDYGNGLYELFMNRLEVADDDALETYKLKSDEKNILYALDAEGGCRGEYLFPIGLVNAEAEITSYKIDGTTFASKDLTHVLKNGKLSFDAKKAHTVATENMSEVYDMWLTAESEDVNLFQLVFDQEKHTFTVNADPDIITKATFTLTVHTLNNNGLYEAQKIEVKVSNKIVADAEYDTRTLNIVSDATKNFFSADMQTMFDAIGSDSNLDVWKKKVAARDVKFYADADLTQLVEAGDETTGIVLSLLDVNGKDVKDNIKNASTMKFNVTNATASANYNVNKVYYAKVTYSTSDGEELNSVVIPFQFKIPAVSTMLTPRAGYVVDDVINAYFYETDENHVGTTAVLISQYFTVNNSVINTADVSFTDDNKYTANGTKYDYLKESDADAKFEDSYLDIVGEFNKVTKKVPAGYGQAVTVKLSKTDYLGWKYQDDAEKSYTFKIRLMSPIYEGTVTPVSGSSITINANDVVNGAKITDKDITGVDYNGNKYCIVSDRAGGTNTANGKPAADWYKNAQIQNVLMGLDDDEYITDIAYQKAYTTDSGTVNGWFVVKGKSLSVTQEIEIPVTITDAWGYEKTVKVPATIVVK